MTWVLVAFARWFSIPKDDGEFVATDTSDDIVFSGHRLHELSGFGEDGVAGGVAVAVVEMFEVVDVEQHESDLEFLLAGVVEDGIEASLEVSAVPDFGEWVFKCEEIEILELLLKHEPA